MELWSPVHLLFNSMERAGSMNTKPYPVRIEMFNSIHVFLPFQKTFGSSIFHLLQETFYPYPYTIFLFCKKLRSVNISRPHPGRLIYRTNLIYSYISLTYSRPENTGNIPTGRKPLKNMKYYPLDIKR